MPTSHKVAADDEPTTTPAPRFLPLETISIRLRGSGLERRSPVFGVVSNMSETGACVITNVSVSDDTEVDVTFGLASAGEVTLPARVVWCAQRLEPVKEIVGYLTGFAFGADSDETVQTLLTSGMFQLVP